MKLKKTMAIIAIICLIISSTSMNAFATNDVAIRFYYDYEGTEYFATYSSLETALTDSGAGDWIYLLDDYTAVGNMTIPTDVTVVIPSDNDLDDYEEGENGSGTIANGTALYTLTIPDNKSLTVNGTLIIAGNQQSGGGTTGCLTGNYGRVIVNGTMDVNGTLYARGEVSGSGTVTINDGATVYQLFQIYDWRGGSESVSAAQNGVFPFSLYEFKNITANTYYFNGSSMIASFYVYAADNDITGEAIIIGDNGMLDFSATSDSNEYIEFTYNSGRITAGVYGDVESGAITVSAMGYTISSAGAILPFGYNLDPYVSAGSSLTVGSGLKVLPGCSFDVDGDFIVNSYGELYFYGANYSSTYNYANWSTTAPATLDVSGTLTNNGVIAASDANTLISISTAIEDQIAVNEYVQNSGTPTVVTFYKMAEAA